VFSVRYELVFYASFKLVLLMKALSWFRRFVAGFPPRMPDPGDRCLAGPC